VEPAPDRKDWTWTLTRRCDQCGLAAGEVDMAEIPDRAEAAAAEWVQILTSSPAVSARPAPEVWSPLEYGAHVRDVYRLFDARLSLMLGEDNPTFDNWDQDQTAIDEEYAESDPDEVATELAAAAESFVARLRLMARSSPWSPSASTSCTTCCITSGTSPPSKSSRPSQPSSRPPYALAYLARSRTLSMVCGWVAGVRSGVTVHRFGHGEPVGCLGLVG
jgi:hypothetical protein